MTRAIPITPIWCRSTRTPIGRQPGGAAAGLLAQADLKPEVFDLRDTLSDLTHLLNRLVGEKVTLTLRMTRSRCDPRRQAAIGTGHHEPCGERARRHAPGGEIRIETENRCCPWI
jgi:hypothetical protein